MRTRYYHFDAYKELSEIANLLSVHTIPYKLDVVEHDKHKLVFRLQVTITPETIGTLLDG